jgi:hypothetical protein
MSTTHLLMRLENIHRRARHAQRRGITDAFVQDNLDHIEREARLALADAHDLLGTPGQRDLANASAALNSSPIAHCPSPI